MIQPARTKAIPGRLWLKNFDFPEVDTIYKGDEYDGIADIYDEVRPDYPKELISDILTITGVDPADTLLEIGAGTGKATVPFANKGLVINALEPGRDMSVILTEKCIKYPNVRIYITTFEDWKPPAVSKFDLIYSAQAFHRIEPSFGCRRCHELLKDGGYLAIFGYGVSNRFVDEPDKQYVIKRVDIEGSGLFKVEYELNYSMQTRNTARELIMARRSVPGFFLSFDNITEINKLVDHHGGYITTVFNYVLYLAKKSKG